MAYDTILTRDKKQVHTTGTKCVCHQTKELFCISVNH